MHTPSSMTDEGLAAQFSAVLSDMAETGCDLLDGAAELVDDAVLENLRAALALDAGASGRIIGAADDVIALDGIEDHELQELLAGLLQEMDRRSLNLLPAAVARLNEDVRQVALAALERWYEAGLDGPER